MNTKTSSNFHMTIWNTHVELVEFQELHYKTHNHFRLKISLLSMVPFFFFFVGRNGSFIFYQLKFKIILQQSLVKQAHSPQAETSRCR